MGEPYVGQVVHYVSYGTPGGEYTSKCRAAVITEVDDATLGVVSLAVLNPSGMFFDRGIPLSEVRMVGGSWHFGHDDHGKAPS